MKEFIINSINDYLILKKYTKYLIGHKGFIAGGCFKNMFNHEKIKDIDIFFRNKEDCDKALSDYYSKVEAGEYYVLYKSDNVTAFKEYKRFDGQECPTIELVKKTFGTPEEILNQFDFTITKFALFTRKDELDELETMVLHHEDFFKHLSLKRLVVDDKLLYPMSTFNRIIKYATYGYFPCRETKQKIVDGLRQLTIEEIDADLGNFYNGVD